MKGPLQDNRENPANPSSLLDSCNGRGLHPDKPLSPAEQKVQNNALYKAITDVMAGILGREATDAEMMGIEDISGHKRT